MFEIYCFTGFPVSRSFVIAQMDYFGFGPITLNENQSNKSLCFSATSKLCSIKHFLFCCCSYSSGTFRKQKFTSMGSRGHVFLLCLLTFWSILFVSCFCWVVITIDFLKQITQWLFACVLNGDFTKKPKKNPPPKKPQFNCNGNVAKQKLYGATQWLCACVTPYSFAVLCKTTCSRQNRCNYLRILSKEAKAWRAQSASRTRGDEREKINACTHTIV